jgi:membrane protein YdbS with pleckstrin-like domain
MEGEQVEYLHPVEAYLRYRKLEFWVMLLVVDILLTAGWIALLIALPWIGVLITPFALALIILPDIVAYIGIHLSYDTTWYVLSDRSMRLCRGVWNLHETTITFENIQNISIQQGPLQRWFGFSNLVVQTAGGGGSPHAGGSMMHTGVLVGLGNAEEIRERILSRCGKYSDTGLGEDDEVETSAKIECSPSGWSVKQIDLLREIRVLTAELAKGD